MKEMIEKLKEHGYKQASLSVAKDNYALKMYKNLKLFKAHCPTTLIHSQIRTYHIPIKNAARKPQVPDHYLNIPGV